MIAEIDMAVVLCPTKKNLPFDIANSCATTVSFVDLILERQV